MHQCLPYRRARACPSPCSGCIKKRPWPLGCGRLSFWREDPEGQAPALRSKRRFSVGANTRGGQAPALRHLKYPASHRRARDRPSPSIKRDRKRPWPLGYGRFSFWRRDRGGQAPARRSKRRFPVGANSRGGQAHALRHLKHLSSQRRARACPSPRIKRDRKRPWPLGCGRFPFGGEIAGDRPPRYVPSDVFRLARTLAGDRPPRYGT